jgi:Tol biopolymer transport system component
MDLGAEQPETTARPLIQSTRRDVTPRFFPQDDRIVFLSTRSGNSEIWMADSDGGNPLRLTQFDGPLSGAPVACADGKRVALDSRAGGRSQLFVLDVDERQPRQLRTEQSLGLPAWSADCRWLLASDGRARLFKLPAGGGAPEPFTAQKSYYAQVVGDRVIFNVKRENGVQLWSRDMTGGPEREIEGLPLIGYNEAWAVTPAGVYFTGQDRGVPTLFFHAFATPGTRRIASLPKTPEPGGGLGISVSADGRWLLYSQAGEAESDIMFWSEKPD